jgi:predicted GIY-YIG superfamily endonuclease
MEETKIKFTFKTPKRKSNKVYGEYRGNNVMYYGEMAKYGNNEAVYGIRNKITNKIYIGTTKHLQRRLLKHFNELHHNRHRTKKLQEDYNTYGKDSFEIIVFDNICSEYKERSIQIEYGIDNIYNEKITGYYITEELRKQRANASKETHRTKEYREKMSKLKTNFVAQYDDRMNLIKIWNSAIEICETLGYTRSVILSCCNLSKKHAYGFNWRYVNKDGNIIHNGYLKARQI